MQTGGEKVVFVSGLRNVAVTYSRQLLVPDCINKLERIDGDEIVT